MNPQNKKITLGILLTFVTAASLVSLTVLVFGPKQETLLEPMSMSSHVPAVAAPESTGHDDEKLPRNLLVNGKATIEASCAPWDGAAIFIRTDLDGKYLGVSLFARGLEDFRSGKKVVIDGGSNSITATGNATLCDSAKKCTAYAAGRVSIQNQSSEYSEEIPLYLDITVDGRLVPVEANWKRESSSVVCG